MTVLLIPSHCIECNLKYVKSKKVIFDIMGYKLKEFRQKGYFLKECEGKEGVHMRITYGYARVSTKDQNLERQLVAIRQFNKDIPENHIFMDKETGKVFDREQYQKMKIILEHMSQMKKEEDIIELVVEELDRLGRNADGIKRELQWFKEHDICVRILEIPTTLTEVKSENKWVMDLINQILIEVYAAMAQQELEKRAKRQAEGIAAAKEKGVRFGRRPIIPEPEKFAYVYNKWKEGGMTSAQAMQVLGLKPNTFYRRVKQYEENR